MTLLCMPDADDTATLPAAAGSTFSAGIDMNPSGAPFGLRGMCLWAGAPALTTTQLPNGQTMVYDLQVATDAAFTTPVTQAAAVIAQTGAGGVGSAGATGKAEIAPQSSYRFARLKATGSASIGDCSALLATLHARE